MNPRKERVIVTRRRQDLIYIDGPYYPTPDTRSEWETNFLNRPKLNSVYIYLQILSFFTKKNIFTFYLDWVMGENTLFGLGKKEQ